MKPYNPGGHAAYQERVLALLRKYYPDAAYSLPPSTWAIMEKFWSLERSELDTIMADRYSDFSPAPRLPSDMLRSIRLSVECKITSYTKWAANLKQNHLHTILSGFDVGDTPGTGTFMISIAYSGFRIKNNLSDPIHPQKEKPKKPGKMEKIPSMEIVSVKELFEQFEFLPPSDIAPRQMLYDIFKRLFLDHSVHAGLIDILDLSLAGDGTTAYTAARKRKNPPVTV